MIYILAGKLGETLPTALIFGGGIGFIYYALKRITQKEKHLLIKRYGIAITLSYFIAYFLNNQNLILGMFSLASLVFGFLFWLIIITYVWLKKRIAISRN